MTMKFKIILIILFITFFPLTFSKSFQKEIKIGRLEKLKYKIEYLSGKKCNNELLYSIYNNINIKYENIILSIITKESEFNQFALSRVYSENNRDYGLMQISDKWWSFDKESIYNVEYNIILGYKIFKYFLGVSNGDVEQALFLYNGSRQYATDVMRINNLLKRKINIVYNEK